MECALEEKSWEMMAAENDFMRIIVARLYTLAKLVDGTVYALTTSEADVSSTDEQTARSDSTVFQTEQDLPASALDPGAVDAMLERLCQVVQESVMPKVALQREEKAILQQRLEAAKRVERGALLVADTLQDELHTARNEVVALKKQFEEAVRDKNRLEQVLTEIRGTGDAKATLLKQVQTLTTLANSLRDSQSAHATADVDFEETILEWNARLETQESVIARQTQLLGVQRESLEALRSRLKWAAKVPARSRAPRKGMRIVWRGSSSTARDGGRGGRRRPRAYPLLSLGGLTGLVTARGSEGSSGPSSLTRNLADDLLDANQREELQRGIVALECENEMLRAELERAKSDLREVSDSQTRLGKLTAEFKARGVMITKLKGELASVESKAVGRELLISELKGRCDNLLTELAAFRSENESLRVEMEALTEAQKLAEEQVKEQSNEHAIARTHVNEPPVMLPRSSIIDTIEPDMPPAAVESAVRRSTSHEHSEREALLSLRRDVLQREALVRETEALKLQMRQKIREAVQTARDDFAARLQDYAAQILQREQIIANLEKRNYELGLQVEKLPSDKGSCEEEDEDCAKSGESGGLEEEVPPPSILLSSRSAAAASNATRPLPNGEFTVKLPSVTTSVKVPIHRFNRHRFVIVHIALPPQKLVLFNRGGSYKIEQLPVEEVAATVVSPNGCSGGALHGSVHLVDLETATAV